MNARDGRRLTERSEGRRTIRLRRVALAAVLLALLVLCGLLGSVASARAAAVPGKPTAKAPKGAVTTATPTFSWSKASGAVKYELRVYQSGTQLLKKTGISKLSWKTSGALPEDVDLTWKVRGSNVRGAGAWSKSLAFQVTVAPPKIGDRYQGGIVAYILQPVDPGYVTGETHGLIAATGDQSSMGIQWSFGGNYMTTGATGVALGTGAGNTTAIIAAQGPPAVSYAAGLARAYNGGGYSDWYLPSKDELNKLYLSKDAIGGSWSALYYWSSSELSEVSAWLQRFDTGRQSADVKQNLQGVHAVRSF